MSKLKNSRAVCIVQGWGLPLDVCVGTRTRPPECANFYGRWGGGESAGGGGGGGVIGGGGKNVS